MNTCNPGAPGNLGNDRTFAVYARLSDYSSGEFRSDYGHGFQALPHLELASRVQQRQPRGYGGPGWRTINPAWPDDHCRTAADTVRIRFDTSGKQTKRYSGQSGQFRMAKGQLLFGRGDNPCPDFGDHSGFILAQLEAKVPGIDYDETVATKRNVHGNTTRSGKFEYGVELINERRNVLEGDPKSLSVPTFGPNTNEAAGRFNSEMRHGLDHRNHSGLEQNRGHANRIRTRHGRIVFGFHYDETNLRLRVPCRHEQIDVSKNTSTRFVEKEVSQISIIKKPTPLFPDRLSRRRRYPADNDVANFTLRMRRNNMDDTIAAHSGAYDPI